MVKFPTTDVGKTYYVNDICAEYLILMNVWATADELKILIHPPTNNTNTQHLFNEWKHSHNVNSLFVFSPDAKIRICLLITVGKFHYGKMEDNGMCTKPWSKSFICM